MSENEDVISRLDIMETRFEERWDAHDKRSLDFMATIEKGGDENKKQTTLLFERTHQQMLKIAKLPCKANTDKISLLQKLIVGSVSTLIISGILIKTLL